jgi:hypothetical protein
MNREIRQIREGIFGIVVRVVRDWSATFRSLQRAKLQAVKKFECVFSADGEAA